MLSGVPTRNLSIMIPNPYLGMGFVPGSEAEILLASAPNEDRLGSKVSKFEAFAIMGVQRLSESLGYCGDHILQRVGAAQWTSSSQSSTLSEVTSIIISRAPMISVFFIFSCQKWFIQFADSTDISGNTPQAQLDRRSWPISCIRSRNDLKVAIIRLATDKEGTGFV
jgi:hypothetical protein